jgi:predicted RNase H-like HicB family nuclease
MILCRHADAVRIEPAEEADYSVDVPALPDRVTDDDAYEKAVAMAQWAIAGFVEVLALDRESIHIEPRSPSIGIRTRLVD